jgi:hypothetical protein
MWWTRRLVGWNNSDEGEVDGSIPMLMFGKKYLAKV